MALVTSPPVGYVSQSPGWYARAPLSAPRVRRAAANAGRAGRVCPGSATRPRGTRMLLTLTTTHHPATDLVAFMRQL
jgi:hypothetical protein